MPSRNKQKSKPEKAPRVPVRASLKNRRKNRKKAKDEATKRHVRLASAFRLFRDSLSLTRQHWRLFTGIVLVYFVLSLFLVGGLGGGFDIRELRQSMGQELGNVSTSIALYGVLLGSAGSAGSATGSAYLGMVVVVVSLATIWALRQLLAGEHITVKNAFYKGMTPLVPFVLVLLALGLMLLPALLGSVLLSAIFGGGLAVTVFEKLLWGMVTLGLLAWSLRLIVTYVFALYIVTLPEMHPVAALKSARLLVRFRRLTIIRKLLFLPFMYLIISAALFLPLIVWVPVIVQWMFVPLSLFGFVFAHVYMYSLYKEVL